MRRLLVALGGLSAAFYAVFIARSAFMLDGRVSFSLFDDAMISMRFARNLAQGFGLAWNPGQPPVEGYTNFLWTLYMALLHRLLPDGSSIALAVMVTGAILLLGLSAVVARLADRLSGGDRLAVGVAVALTAFHYPLVFWTLRGMEVGLLALLVYSAMLLAFGLTERYSGRRLLALCGVLALALLTRLDAVIPHVLISLYTLLTLPRERRAAAAAALGASFVGPLGAQTAFRLAYYHAWLPNTYYLKVTGVSLASRLARGLKTLLQAWGFHLFAYAAALPAAWLGGRLRDRRTWLLLALLGAQAAYSVYVGGDAWEWIGGANRFLTMAVPGLAILAGLGVSAWVAAARERAPAFGAMTRGVWIVGGLGLVARGALWLWPPAPEPRHAAMWMGAGLAVAVGGWLASRPLAGRLAPFVAARPAIAAVACAVLMLGLAEDRLLVGWARDNAIHMADDANAVRCGLFLRHVTAPEAVIAVMWAGAIPYYAERTTLDLLGKSDPVIAKGPPATAAFFPGHNKWNFAYSLGQLQPDLVVQYYESPDNNRAIARWGYDRLPNGMFVRRSSSRVDRVNAGRAWTDPAVLGPLLKAP